MWLMCGLVLGAMSAYATPAIFDEGPEAEDTGWAEENSVDLTHGIQRPDSVVGGTVVALGDWDDAAGVVVGQSYVGCTGVLIAPRVVLTAGHCVGGITHVVLGSKDWMEEQGEFIEVQSQHEYPDSWATIDLAVLVLEERATTPYRPIAADCIIDDYLMDGADVAVVGFGNTNSNGNGSTSELHEGITQIQDHDCDEQTIDGMYTGCNDSVSPGSELGAGGNGVDSCFGDSGGPLYLLTERGDYVVGITSRAYAGVPASQPCLYGGIYGRPDAALDFIDSVAPKPVPRPQCNETPIPEADTLRIGVGRKGKTQVDVYDPDQESGHTYVILEQPTFGIADIDENGLARYEALEAAVESDFFVVGVIDAGHEVYEASGPITAELTVLVSGSGCGCKTVDQQGFVGWVFLLLSALVYRRRLHLT